MDGAESDDCPIATRDEGAGPGAPKPLSPDSDLRASVRLCRSGIADLLLVTGEQASEVLVNAGIIEESVDTTPSPLQQQRLTRDEERLGEEIFGASIEQELYGRYKDRGLVVLGFPSNDFVAQEPGTHEEIKAFVSSKYAVDFPMFEKVATKGPEQAPLYATLTTETADGIAGEVQWNFTKFLVDPEGRVVERFEPKVKPMDETITSAVERVLPAPAQ